MFSSKSIPSLIHWISALASDAGFANATFFFNFSDKKVMERKERCELQKNKDETIPNSSNVYAINLCWNKAIWRVKM
ncbi:hypothetical protein D3C76_1276040 [compost metagenome]